MNRCLPFLAAALLVLFAACGGGADAPAGDAPSTATAPAPAGLPVQTVELGPIDAALATQGQQVFDTRCTTCHKMDARYVGPPLGDVTERRTPEYVMNMILAPEKMLQHDADAKALLAEYSVPMTNQNLSHEEARAILEYLRQVAEATN